MTDTELIDYFSTCPLPVCTVQFSSYERTDDVRHMVTLAIERIQADRQGADTSRRTLFRLKAYLDSSAQPLESAGLITGPSNDN